MKALTRTSYGPPSCLSIQEIERPAPKKGEVLVRVHATTINRTDCGILYGKPYAIRLFTGLRTPRHSVPGTDFAGEVTAIGAEVRDFKVGDRVWGLNDEGLQSHAEFLCMNEKKAIAKIPDHVSYVDAAASAEGAHYCFNFLNKVKLNPSDKVMVNGATGAIGSAAVQLLKYRGNYVAATANTKNMERISAFGVDKLINYEKEDFTKDNEQYNFVFDTVGKSTFSKCKPLLLPGGVYVSSELGPGAENLYLPLTTMFSKRRVIFPIPSNVRRSILYMTQLLEERKFTPLIDDLHCTMESVNEAYDYVHQGLKTGNVILRIVE